MDFTWFLPSMYGDIKLDRLAESSTQLTLNGLSPTEKDAVQALFKRATKPGTLQTAWASKDRISSIDLNSMKEQALTLDAPILKVQEFLQRKLKPHRKMISAVKFTSGRVEQITEATLETIDAVPEKPKAAVSVAQPVIGCPAPDFDDVETRATRVLKTFLTPEQIEDFERHQQFVAVGADTGHRYLITSRNSRHGLAKHQSYRSLYDMDERQPFCVHDWEVPAPEELLGLFMHISLPGLEMYVRSIPDRDGILEHVR